LILVGLQVVVVVCASFVDGSPDGLPFAVICLVVRVVEALGAAALVTSSFAIIANTFPDSITAMFVRTTTVQSGIAINVKSEIKKSTDTIRDA